MNLGNQNSKYSWRICDLENPQTGTQFANSILMYKIELSLGLFYSLIILLSKYVLQIKMRNCLGPYNSMLSFPSPAHIMILDPKW